MLQLDRAHHSALLQSQIHTIVLVCSTYNIDLKDWPHLTRWLWRSKELIQATAPISKLGGDCFYDLSCHVSFPTLHSIFIVTEAQNQKWVRLRWLESMIGS